MLIDSAFKIVGQSNINIIFHSASYCVNIAHMILIGYAPACRQAGPPAGRQVCQFRHFGVFVIIDDLRSEIKCDIMMAMEENLQKQSSVFWIEVDKIKPNPMQPRREFDETCLASLADSIRQYGVLQPLVVTRKEIEGPNGIAVEYELIAGERRLRASRLAGLYQVPVIIRKDTEDKIKLELAIIENIQREDLNPVERALAFKKLIDSFNLKHHEVAERVGKSRVFVTNSLRLLNLPEEIQTSLRGGLISEGHMRPLLMLSERKEEQTRLYFEILEKKLSVRQAEAISRKIAVERARKKEGSLLDIETRAIEEKLSETLGTRVHIEKTRNKGRIHIDFFSEEELSSFLEKLEGGAAEIPSKRNVPGREADESEGEYLSAGEPAADAGEKAENGEKPEKTEADRAGEEREEIFVFDGAGCPNGELPEEIRKREEYNRKLMEELSAAESSEGDSPEQTPGNEEGECPCPTDFGEAVSPGEADQPDSIEELRKNFTI